MASRIPPGSHHGVTVGNGLTSDVLPSGRRFAAWKATFRALRHRNFRLFIGAQAVSLLGTWMQNLAQNWLVYRLTASELAVGFAGFCAHAPVLAFGPAAGWLADRFSRHRVVVATQAAFLLQAALLAWLVLSGRVAPVWVYALALVWGLINVVDVPARQSLYIHLVGRQDLMNAISLNSAVFNGARLLGPALAGLMIAAWGEGVCFVINAVTFVPVLVALGLIRLRPLPLERERSLTEAVGESFRYVRMETRIRALLLVNALANLSRGPAIALAPFFADAIFHRGSQGLGMLNGLAGLGAVTGTLLLARKTDARGLGHLISANALLTSVSLVAIAMVPSYELLLVLFALLGYSQMRQNASVNTLLQSLVPERLRGRMMALYAMTVTGVLPVGHLVGGAIAEQLGVRITVLIAGVACLAGALAFRRHVPALEWAVEKGM